MEQQLPTRRGSPSASRRTRAALQSWAGQLRRALASLASRARRWEEDLPGSSSFVPASETVMINTRRHPVLLVVPAARTLAGAVALANGLGLLPLLAFALITAVWAKVRLRPKLRKVATIAGGSIVALLVLAGLFGPLLCMLLLLAWAVEDLADWHADRLIVSNRRIYRRYGILTRHSPSIALTGVAYIDPVVPLLGRLIGYGTLRLDSLSQRDAPLSRFALMPDVVALSHEILALRAKAMPKFPLQPY